MFNLMNCHVPMDSMKYAQLYLQINACQLHLNLRPAYLLKWMFMHSTLHQSENRKLAEGIEI
jgi:hypothetical protein